MKTERETTRIVRSWLEMGADRLPDRVLDSVLELLPSHRQRRRPLWRLTRRFSPMNAYAKLAIAAAAVLVVAILGYKLLPGNGVGTIVPTPSPTLAPSPTSLPSLNGQDPLAAGRYVVDAGLAVDVSVAVPDGWSASGGWVAIGPRGNEAPAGMAIRFYWIDNLAADPLSHVAGNMDPPVGPTVDDLVDAIVAHPGWTAGVPSDIAFDGRLGKLVSIMIPLDVDLSVGDGNFYLSTDPGGGGIWGWEPGQTFDWYILDVDGERLIIDAFHYPGTSAEDLAAQQTVVESVEFLP